MELLEKLHPPHSNFPSLNSKNSQGLFVLALSPRAIPQSTAKYLPRGAWKFPCSTRAELEVPDAAVVTSNPIDKVGPVARTGERASMWGWWVGRRDVGLPEVSSPCLSPIQSLPPILSRPHPAVLNHPPMAVSNPTSPAFLLQGPKAPELEQPRTRMKLAQWVCLIHVRAGEKSHILRGSCPLWHWAPVQSPERSPREEGHIPALWMCCDRAKSREKSKMG